MFCTKASALTPWEYNKIETQSYFEGLNSIQINGWGELNSKVQPIVMQLVQYSNKIFKVVPGQTFQWGQAHAGGWIILDISSASKQESILAFRLSHEWGHEDLGHQPNIYSPQKKQWIFKNGDTREEDEADLYAAKFLAIYNYPIAPVLVDLQSLPASPTGDTHSTGTNRAINVKHAYNNEKYSCQIDADSCVDSIPSDYTCMLDGVIACANSCYSYRSKDYCDQYCTNKGISTFDPKCKSDNAGRIEYCAQNLEKCLNR